MPKGAAAPLPKLDAEEIVRRAKQGDAGMIPYLKILMKFDPNFPAKIGADLPTFTLGRLCQALTPNDYVVWEAIMGQLVTLRASLRAEGDDSVLDHLIVERVVCTYLAVQVSEIYQAASISSQTQATPAGRAIREQLTRDQARHLAAVKSLATIRKLLRVWMRDRNLIEGSVPHGAKKAQRKPVPDDAIVLG